MDQHRAQIEEQEPTINNSYGKDLEGLGVAQRKVREHNSQLILEYLRKRGPALRADVAKSLNLSRATVTTIVKKLLTDALVVEEEKSYLANGILTNRIRFNAGFGSIIGIDLGQSRLRVYLTNLEANIIDQSTERFDMQVSLEQKLTIIARKVRDLVNSNNVDWTHIRGIGMGVPGAVNREGTRIISPPDLQKYWGHIDIPAVLRERLELALAIPIYLDNDANMGALGESRYGRGHGVDNMIYIKLSTHMNAALILRGQLYRGETGTAGGFGHLRIQYGQTLAENSPSCPSCHERGCLEAWAGLHAIVSKVHNNPSSVLYGPIPEEKITPEHIAEIILAANQGDAASSNALEEAGGRIGVAIGSCLINFYNPALILLDGGIVRPSRGGQVYENFLLLEHLQRNAYEASLPVTRAETNISLGKLGDDAVGLGAVATVIDRDPALNLSMAI